MSDKKNKIESLNKGFKVPDSYVIIFFVVALAALLTYIVPQGYFSTIEDANTGKTVIEQGSFQYVTDESGAPLKEGIPLFKPFGEVGFFNYAFEGMVKGSKWGTAVGIIAFILVIGGAFGIILKTGAVEAGILKMIKTTKGKEVAIIPIIFILFSLGGAVFGMGEEAIPFAMILVPLVIAMGYDAVVGILMTYVATQIGFAASWMNPFSVAIAQGIADVPVLSGAGFRVALWVFFTAFGVVFTMLYALKIKKNPMASVSYESDAYYRNDMSAKKDIDVQFGIGHILVLLTIVAGMVWVIWGVVTYEYYIPEIATQFFIMGLVSGVIGVVFKLNDMNVNDIASSFRQGASDLVGAAMIVGMAQGIILVLGGTEATDGSVLNTILNSASSLFVGVPAALAGVIMYLFQAIFNFFVVSGSGQAALTMPLMAPLADLVGVSRQTAVLAFQLGDGFTNILVPTSGCLMGILAVAKLDWSNWIKFAWKLGALLIVFSMITMLIASAIGFN